MIAAAALRLVPGDDVWWRSRGAVHVGTVVDMRYQAGKILRVTVYGYRGRQAMSYRRLHKVHPLDVAQQMEMPEMAVAPGRVTPLPLPPSKPRPAAPPVPITQGSLLEEE